MISSAGGASGLQSLTQQRCQLMGLRPRSDDGYLKVEHHPQSVERTLGRMREIVYTECTVKLYGPLGYLCRSEGDGLKRIHPV